MNRSEATVAEHPAPKPGPVLSLPIPSFHRHSGLALLGSATFFLKSLIFAPVSLWPLAFVCLVPWILMVVLSPRAPRVYAHTFAWSFVFFLVNMRWLYPATGAGYVALSFYLALYFLMMACAFRHVARRRPIPLAISFPCIWVAGEFLRAVVLSGFPWFFLSHSVYNVLTLVQVSDVVGAYGTSFVIAAVNGAVADWLIRKIRPEAPPTLPSSRAVQQGGHTSRPQERSIRERPPQARQSAIVAASVLLAAFAYGQVQLRRDASSPGPRIAVLQGDYLMTVTTEESNDMEKRKTYFEMLDAASAQKPDIYLLPETPWMMYLNDEGRNFTRPPLSRSSFDALQKHAREKQAYVVTGSASIELTPLDLLARERRYNSAMVFYPDGREPGRYDKVHLVPFGEVVPFRFGKLRFLYFWMNSIMPFSGPKGDYEFSLFYGDGFHAFEMNPTSMPGKTFRFGIPICYEDVMPYVAREFTRGADGKRVDFLLNISNDGWFGRGVQQPQHLAICAFRAVENRVGIARSVNTGVSAIIDPTGKIRHRVKGDPNDSWPRDIGFSVGDLRIDSRYTLYTRYGDWFAWACAAALVAFLIDYWIMRARALIED